MDSDSRKQIVRRFNIEVIQNGRRDSFEALMAPGFVNGSAPTEAQRGRELMWHTFEHVLLPALGGLAVRIHEQLCDGEKVTTRKTITGTHTGELMGIAATGRAAAIEVIDIVTVRDGQLVEHWGINSLMATLAQLRSA